MILILQSLRIKDRNRFTTIEYFCGQLEKNYNHDLPYWNISIQTTGKSVSDAFNYQLKKNSNQLEGYKILIKNSRQLIKLSPDNKYNFQSKEWDVNYFDNLTTDSVRESENTSN